MPLYEFRCPEGHDFEKFYRSIGAAQVEEKCPECGAIAERLMSTAGLVFKGSGFYITDYGKDGKKAEREAVTAQEKSRADAEKKTTDAAVKTSDSAAAGPAKPASEAKPATDSKPAPPAATPAAKPAASASKPE